MKTLFMTYPSLVSFFFLAIIALIALAIRKSNEPEVPAIEEPPINPNANQRPGSVLVNPQFRTIIPRSSFGNGNVGGSPGAGGRVSNIKS